MNERYFAVAEGTLRYGEIVLSWVFQDSISMG